MDSQNVWDEILARVETKVGRHSFYTWFKPTAFLSETGQRPARSGCPIPCSATG